MPEPTTTAGDIDPRIEEHVEWIEQVLDRGVKYGWRELQQAVKDLEDKHAKALLFVAMTAMMLDRAKLEEHLKEMRRKRVTAPFN